MNAAAATEFLHALARTLSVLGLYPEGHAARERVLEDAFEKLLRALEGSSRVTFGFLGSEVLFQGRALREMRDWEWASRLPEAGIQRVELDASVTQGELEEFIDVILIRLGQVEPGTAQVSPMRSGAIRWGALGLRDADEDAGVAVEGATIAVGLIEEAETVQWIHGEIAAGTQLPLMEAEAVVRSLAVAMHGDQHVLLPLARLRDFDEYTTTHSLNVSVLAMALAEWIGLSDGDIRSVGIAGLLHDLGKVRVPIEILTKPGKLTAEEREVMNRHPADGAELILGSRPNLDLAATVAYEHHVMLDGGGYPTFTYARECHYASRLVHVCDVYDALRTDRPYRDAWPQEKILDYLRERSGSEFDQPLANAFVKMIQQWEPREVDDWRPGQPAAESAEQVQDELPAPHGERLERAVLGGDE